jgi:hypothetical protein
MSPTVPPPIQLPLPLVSALTPTSVIAPAPLPPRSVWAGLAPPARTQFRQRLVALLQEVARVRDAH